MSSVSIQRTSDRREGGAPRESPSATVQNASCDTARVLLARGAAFAWLLGVATWAAGVAWISSDGASQQAIGQALALIGVGDGNAAAMVRNPARLPVTVYALLAGGAAIFAALTTIIAALAVGPPRSRGVRRWLGLVTLACLWLGLAVGWRDLHWHGQQRRVGRQLEAVADVAAQLRADWPTTDGEIEAWGPYLAYPKGVPSTLLLLSYANIPRADFSIASIERTAADGVAFEIAGSDAGAWLCWRPDGSPPESFVGGLQTRYRVERSTQIAADWFVARFRPTGPGTDAG